MAASSQPAPHGGHPTFYCIFNNDWVCDSVSKSVRPFVTLFVLIQLMVTEGKSLVTKGKTLVTEGKTLVTIGNTLVTEGKTLVTKGNTLVTKGKAAGPRVERPDRAV